MKDVIQKILASADIQINGPRSWDIQVVNDQFYQRVLSGGSLALGESYMEGWWECQALDILFYKILKSDLERKFKANWSLIWSSIKANLFNLQRRSKAYNIAHKHYNLGNDLYRSMLDKRMTYTCGYWENAQNLDDAQEAKLDLICKKLYLEPGMTLLDIGCGWGSLAKYAAEKYGVKVTGITVSKEQVALARELCQSYDIDIQLKDYREVQGQYDRVVSVGMIEHVGYKNFSTFMQVAHRCLREDGIFLLHTIGNNISMHYTDPWIDKYIFPNSMLPSAHQITQAAEGLFMLQDWENFGTYYDKTLMAWHQNFNNHWEQLKQDYDERFHRMWNYYLLSCAGSFRAHKNQLWQIVFTKTGSELKYRRKI